MSEEQEKIDHSRWQMVWVDQGELVCDDALPLYDFSLVSRIDAPATDEDISGIEESMSRNNGGRRCVLCDFSFETPVPAHAYSDDFHAQLAAAIGGVCERFGMAQPVVVGGGDG